MRLRLHIWIFSFHFKLGHDVPSPKTKILFRAATISPIVVSQNFSSATSLAMLAPISTLIVMPSFSWMTSEMSLSPSGPSSMPWRDRNVKKLAAGPETTLKLQGKKANLNEGYPQCVTLNLALHGVAHFTDELMGDHKDQDVCIFRGVHQVWHCQLGSDGGGEGTREGRVIKV